jgi:adenine phosphoribosyltransferase
MENLKDKIRSIPDFPQKGILFRDITTLLRDGKAFAQVIDAFAERYSGKRIDAVASIEARGFIIGGALACRIETGTVPIRKKGKLPWDTCEATYDLEYGKDTLEIHKDAFRKGDNVLIADDLLATGGTMSAAIDLVEQLGANVVELAFMIELEELKGREKLSGYSVFSLIKY